MKVLVTRTDRLGDLVLSLPVFAEIKRVHPDWEVHALVAPELVPLIENDPHVHSVWVWSGHEDRTQRRVLKDELAQQGFSAAVMLQYRQELAILLRSAGIKRRYGPLSKFSSWFLLNRGSWQTRSRRWRHELDFNLDLVRRLTGSASCGDREMVPQLHLSAGQRAGGLEFRRQEAPAAKVMAFIHPGSGGSALDWEPRRFAGVANALAGHSSWRVFLTGSGLDQGVFGEILPHLKPEVGVLLDRFPLRDFLGILAAGDLLIGPSTGPLHMAAALGLGVVGLFPPVLTMSPARWGPRSPLSEVLVPEVVCPADRTCQGPSCSLYNCLKKIYERDVIATALAVTDRLLAARSLAAESEPEA